VLRSDKAWGAKTVEQAIDDLDDEHHPALLRYFRPLLRIAPEDEHEAIGDIIALLTQSQAGPAVRAGATSSRCAVPGP
jgi:hypothetical protein